jgi:hypothetical protein
MTSRSGLITILTPCRNERDNVRVLCEKVREVMSGLSGVT